MSNIITNIENILADYFSSRELLEYRKKIGDERAVKKQFLKIKNRSQALYDDWYYYLAKLDILISFAQKKLKKARYFQMLFHAGNVAVEQGYYGEAERILLKLIAELKNNSSFDELKALAYLSLSDVYVRYAGWEKSARLIKSARSIFKTQKNYSKIYECNSRIEVINIEKGNIEKAESRLEENLLLVAEKEDALLLAQLENSIAVINTMRGNFDKALSFYKKSIERFKKAGDPNRQIGGIIHNIGVLYTNKEDNRYALLHFNKSIRLAKKYNNLPLLTQSYFYKAFILAWMKEFDKAKLFLKMASEICNQINDPLSIAEVGRIKGIVDRELKNYLSAESYFLTSLRINRELGNELNQAETNYELGILYNLTGRTAESKKAFVSAYNYFEKSGVIYMVNKIKALLDLNSLIISLKTKKVFLFILSSRPIVVEGIISFLKQQIFAENVSVTNCMEKTENDLQIDFLQYLQRLSPEPESELILILDDFDLPVLLTLKPTRKKIKTLVFTGNNNTSYLLELLTRGINGVVHSTSPRMNLLEAIKSVLSGSVYIDPVWAQNNDMAPNLFNNQQANTKREIKPSLKNPDNIFRLSKREKELLMLIGEGKKNKEIAKTLFISSSTIDTHKSNILKKLKLSSTADLAIYAATFKEKYKSGNISI